MAEKTKVIDALFLIIILFLIIGMMSFDYWAPRTCMDVCARVDTLQCISIYENQETQSACLRACEDNLSDIPQSTNCITASNTCSEMLNCSGFSLLDTNKP